MTVQRIIGTETEFGVAARDPHIDSYARAIHLSTEIVRGYAAISRAIGPAVRWDYNFEDPLLDLRGTRLPRAAAHPSQLTDNPDAPAAAVENPYAGIQVSVVSDDSVRPQPTNVVTTAGARFYVDHAHPEYSAPEVVGPEAATLYDRAGEELARIAMRECPDIALFKNNVDGKGASWGTHENYLLDRTVPFATVRDVFMTFFVMRPLLCGAGRIGGGQRSTQALFQISQRADFVENEVGLETTFNRPIINTRDEPHAPSERFRRFHVIGGDANQFDCSTYLRIASTAAVCWLAEHKGQAGLPLLTEDPVRASQTVSRDLAMTRKYETTQGRKTALEILRAYLNATAAGMEASGELDAPSARAFSLWSDTLDDLAVRSERAERRVEWFAKLRLFERMRERDAMGWDDSRLIAADLRWADLSDGRGLVQILDRGGRVERMFTDAQVKNAVVHPPRDTRAYARGCLIAQFPQVVGAGWTNVVMESCGRRIEINLSDPQETYESVIEMVKEQL